MTCYKCDGHLCQDKMHDLPRAYREFFCVNCGQRFWMDARTHTVELAVRGYAAAAAVGKN